MDFGRSRPGAGGCVLVLSIFGAAVSCCELYLVWPG
jgi:hypothetical protein